MSGITYGLPTKAQFMEQVDKIFRSRLRSGLSIELTLESLEEHVSTDTHENFSLSFRGPLDMKAQGLYQMENEELGAFELFLVPIRQDADGMVFEAIFNQLPDANADTKPAKV